jgi:hypothetical protein
MTPDRTFDLDSRTDVEGLWHRAGIVAAPVIGEFGHEAVDSAVCQFDVDLDLARLPHRECGTDPSTWTGAALLGTRDPQYSGAMIRDGGAVEFMVGPGLPSDRIEIAERLIGESGFACALVAFLSLAGWPLDYAVDFADRLRKDDVEARAIIAERIAAAAVRQMWIAVCGTGCPTVDGSGAIRVVRALLDAAAAILAVIDAEIAAAKPAPAGAHDERAKLAVLLVHRLGAMITRIDTMQNGVVGKHAMHLSKLVAEGRELVDGIGRFTISTGTAVARCKFVARLLEKKGGYYERTGLTDHLDSFNARLANLDNSPGEPAWPEAYRRGIMVNLADANRARRAAGLDAVRGDRLYALIMSRRLDRIYIVAPWLCAPSASFPLVFGGPPGGIAQLLEAARAMEVGHELKRRLFDVDNPNRLDIPKGRAAFATAASVQTQVAARRRAGFLLAATSLSHHMVKAYIAGKHLASLHPIPVVLSGGIGYDFSASVTDLKTAETVATTETAQPIYGCKDYDRDLPRFMGMTLVQMLGCAVFEIFDASLRGPWFAKQRNIACGKGKSAALPGSHAMRDLVRSMLLAIDTAASASCRASGSIGTRNTDEADRFDGLIGGRRGSVYHEETAQGLRRDAARRAKLRGARADDLRGRVDRARVWTPTSKVGRIDEEGLARVLDGRDELPGHLPVGHVFYPALWLRSDIDRLIVEWIARGVPADAAPGGTSHLTAQSARAKVVELEAQEQGCRLGTADVTDRLVRALVPVFTGLSGTTADPAHREGLTWLARAHAAKVRIVNNDERTNDNVAAAARRSGAQDQDKGSDGRSRDGEGFAVQSTLPSAGRHDGNFGIGSRIERCRTDQRRARRRSR